MTKADLVSSIADKMETSKAEAERFLNTFIDEVTVCLKKKQEVRLVGFGTFKVSKRKARLGRNPQTGKEIKIPARNVPAFRPGTELKKVVAGGK